MSQDEINALADCVQILLDDIRRTKAADDTTRCDDAPALVEDQPREVTQ